MVGGLRGSAVCTGRPKGKKGSRGNMVSRGEKTPSLGVGGTSTNCIPGIPVVKDSWSGLLVMVSARGDMSAASSGRLRTIVTCRSWIVSCFFSAGFGAGPRFRDAKPKLPSEVPNLCAPNPGEGGGFENGFGGGNPGDMGGRDSSSGVSPGDGVGFDSEGGASLGDRGGFDNFKGAGPGDGGGRSCELPDEVGRGSAACGGASPGDGGGWGCELPPDEAGFGSVVVCGGASRESRLNRPNFPGSDSSSFSVHEKLEGADDGPGEIGSPLLGVEFPRARFGLLSGVPRFEAGLSDGSGAVRGSFGDISILSADMVARCFVGLLPDRVFKPPPGESLFFLDTSFWKSCRQYINLMLGLIHLLFACAA